MTNNKFDFDFDFGFSAVSAEEIKNPNYTTEVEELQAQVDEQKEKTLAILKAIMPLLNNLTKDPDSEYIHWPNRFEKINEFKKKLLSLQ